MKNPASGYYPFLDGIRAVAVIGVILFHYNVAHITGGYVGVDIFFVLSGFLITGVIDTAIQQNRFTFIHFYERRCRRILPALFIVCMLSAITALLIMMPHDFIGFAKSLKGTALFYSNMIFAKTSYFADPLSTRALLHTWSLAVEEQFYLIYPPILFGLYKLTRGRQNAICFGMAILFLASLILNIVMIETRPDKAFYILPTRAWELLAGGLVFLGLRRIALSHLAAETAALLGAACITLSFTFYDRNTLFPGWAALLPCLGAVLIIWSNLQTQTAIGKVLSSRPFVLTGLISYGLYLYHWPILVFTRYTLDREPTLPETLLAILATFAISILSYKMVEMPIRSGALLKTRKKIFLFSFIGILVMVIFAIAGAKSGGFPTRFSGTVLQYAAGNKDIQDWEKRVPAFQNLNEKTALRIGTTTAKPTFLLWGDSHAEAIAPAIEARTKAFGVSGLFVEYSGCLPLFGVSRLDHAPKNAPCHLVGEKVLTLLNHNHIKNVILAGRWDDIYGWEKGSIEVGQPEALIAFTTPDGHQLERGPAFARAFEETISVLSKRGVHVWVIEQVPPQLVDVPSALAKTSYFGRDPKSLERTYQDIELRRQPTDVVFAAFRKKGGVTFIDPADKFCPEQKRCLIENEGHALYRDSNHLSIYGALWSENIMDPIFAER